MRRSLAVHALRTVVVIAGCVVVYFTMLPPAHTSVISWELAKFRGYEQTSNAAPTDPVFFEIDADLHTDNQNDFTAVSLGGAPGSPLNLTTDDGGFSWDFTQEFLTQAAMDAALPDNSIYTFDATTTLGVIREEITTGPGFDPIIPHFIGTIYDQLQGMDPDEDFELMWNPPPALSGTALFIDDLLLDVEVLDTFLAPGITSFTIPGGTLQADREYGVLIEFPVITNDVRDSFLTGEGIAVHGNSTQINFIPTFLPEPSSMLLGVSGLMAMLFIRRAH